jgi:hypothetical protein
VRVFNSNMPHTQGRGRGPDESRGHPRGGHHRPDVASVRERVLPQRVRVVCRWLCVVMMTVCDIGRHTCGASGATLLAGTDAVDVHAALEATTHPLDSVADLVPTITPTHPVATSSSTFTTSTTSTRLASTTMLCGGVARCLDHTQCAQCLEAINSTADFPHSIA